MIKKFRNAFLTGLLIFLPLGTTIFVVNFLLDMFKNPALRLSAQLGLREESFFVGLETLLSLAGLVVGVLALTLLGFFSNYVLGKFFINSAEKLLGRVPFVSTVYRTVKQIVDTFGKQNRAVFNQVVMIEYPRRDCYAIGFLTNDAEGETCRADSDRGGEQKGTNDRVTALREFEQFLQQGDACATQFRT